MRTDIKAAWLAALRDGSYTQAKGKLRKPGGHCCLGVLCDLHSKAMQQPWGNPAPWKYDYLKHDVYLPEEVREWADIPGSNPTLCWKGEPKALSDINDDGTSFEEIARLIEEQL